MLAFAAGIARVAGGRILSAVALVYIEIFRGTSLLVQLFWLYYALPLIGISFGPVVTGVVGAGAQYRRLWGRGGARRPALGARRAARGGARAELQPRLHAPAHSAAAGRGGDDAGLRQSRDPEPQGHGAGVADLRSPTLTFQAQQLRNITLDSVRIYSLALFGYFIMALILAGFMRWLERGAQARRRISARRPGMMYGYSWDTSTLLTYAISILPILRHRPHRHAGGDGAGLPDRAGAGPRLRPPAPQPGQGGGVADGRRGGVPPRHAAPDAALLSLLRAAGLRHRAARLPHRRASLSACNTRPIPPRSIAAASTPCRAASGRPAQRPQPHARAHLPRHRDPAGDPAHPAGDGQLSRLDAEGHAGPLGGDRGRDAGRRQHDRRPHLRVSGAALDGGRDLPHSDAGLLRRRCTCWSVRCPSGA